MPLSSIIRPSPYGFPPFLASTVAAPLLRFHSIYSRKKREKKIWHSLLLFFPFNIHFSLNGRPWNCVSIVRRMNDLTFSNISLPPLRPSLFLCTKSCDKKILLSAYLSLVVSYVMHTTHAPHLDTVFKRHQAGSSFCETPFTSVVSFSWRKWDNNGQQGLDLCPNWS